MKLPSGRRRTKNKKRARTEKAKTLAPDPTPEAVPVDVPSVDVAGQTPDYANLVSEAERALRSALEEVAQVTREAVRMIVTGDGCDPPSIPSLLCFLVEVEPGELRILAQVCACVCACALCSFPSVPRGDTAHIMFQNALSKIEPKAVLVCCVPGMGLLSFVVNLRALVSATATSRNFDGK